MKLLIVIVNYRTPDVTIGCLHTLLDELDQMDDVRVTVVDNASGDDSVSRLDDMMSGSRHAERLRLLPATRNGGFAFGNNEALREALDDDDAPEYVLLLNPDTLVRPGAIATLVTFMDEHPSTGICGPRLVDGAGVLQRSAHLRPTPLGELAQGAQLGMLHRLMKPVVGSTEIPDASTACDWVSGAALMVRREVFDAVGLLDEEFFLYYEEVDFCCRAREAGWETWYVPASTIVHLEGCATGIKTRRRRPAYWYESRRRFFVKFHGIVGLIAADALWAIGRVSLLGRRILQRRRPASSEPRWFMMDLLGGDLMSLVTGRAFRLVRRGSTS